MITSPEKYKKICFAFITSFAKGIPEYYDPEDQRREYIQGKTRLGQKASLPIMILAIAAELIRYAKSLP